MGKTKEFYSQWGVSLFVPRNPAAGKHSFRRKYALNWIRMRVVSSAGVRPSALCPPPPHSVQFNTFNLAPRQLPRGDRMDFYLGGGGGTGDSNPPPPYTPFSEGQPSLHRLIKIPCPNLVLKFDTKHISNNIMSRPYLCMSSETSFHCLLYMIYFHFFSFMCIT